jgi:hypothetical protein
VPEFAIALPGAGDSAWSRSRSPRQTYEVGLQVLVRCVCGIQVSARGFPDGVQIRFGVITIGLEKSSPNRSGVSNMAPIRSAYLAM